MHFDRSMMYDTILPKSNTISEKCMSQFSTFLESFVSSFVVTRRKEHSEGESLRGGEKRDSEEIVLLKNGVFGGRAASCEGSEEPRIDQARILGGPDNSLLWPGRCGIS